MDKFKLKNKRLFTFGCSFTQYITATWADILSQEFEYFENWGKTGAGNLYIFNSIIECNKQHKFTSDDTIIIMWSGIDRVDKYINQTWIASGIQAVNTEIQFDIRGSEISNYAYIDVIHQLFSSNNLNYKMLSLYPFYNKNDVYKFYKDTLDSIALYPYSQTIKKFHCRVNLLQNTYLNDVLDDNLSFNRHKSTIWSRVKDFLYNNDIVLDTDDLLDVCKQMGLTYDKSTNLIIYNDQHPTPQEHLTALRQLFPEYTFSDQTVNWVKLQTNGSLQNPVPYQTNFPIGRL